VQQMARATISLRGQELPHFALVILRAAQDE
jgi:hypothetical protein